MKPKQTPASNTKNKSVQLATAIYQGPLPPPEQLAQYDRLVPGSADRIIKMAESEAAHRHDIERTVVTSHFNERKHGQIFGFTIGVIAIISGALTAILGHEISGAIIGGGGVIGLVSVFVIGRKTQTSSDAVFRLDVS